MKKVKSMENTYDENMISNITTDIMNTDMYKRHKKLIDVGCYHGVKDSTSKFYLFSRIIILIFSLTMTYFAVCKWIFITPFDPTSLLDVWTLLTYIVCLSLAFFSFMISLILYKKKCSKSVFEENQEKKERKKEKIKK